MQTNEKQFFLVVDTETTQPVPTLNLKSTVVDFGGIIMDRQGRHYETIACLIANEYKNRELFYLREDSPESIWSLDGLKRRKDNYEKMLDEGHRMLAGTRAVNNWLHKALGKYPHITLAAYNLPFDLTQCNSTGISLNIFGRQRCIWRMAIANICKTKKFRQFCLDNHLFNNRTQLGNATYKTNCEVVANFLLNGNSHNNNDYMKEPHTAYEDCKIEAEVLRYIVNKKAWAKKTDEPYNWRDMQLKDNYIAR